VCAGAAMAEDRFLLVRMSSLGDIIHTLPAAAALRESFAEARIDWLVERRWEALLSGNPDMNRVVTVDRSDWRGIGACVRELRSEAYSCALDFQSLYRSAILAYASGAPRRVGFDREYAREGLASLLYTQEVHPTGRHKVEHNFSLVEAIGARTIPARFPLMIPAEAEESVHAQLARNEISEFYVVSPGGGWASKCWPEERYGELHRELVRRHGWRGIVSFGSGERELAEVVRRSAGSPAPVLLEMDLAQLMAVLRRAKFFVGADTGPLHLASALGTPVVGLYGPTDPARNGPYASEDIVVRNAGPEETTYKRGASHSASMLSITVGQVVKAIERRLGMA
jgi:heptosyltransferase I